MAAFAAEGRRACAHFPLETPRCYAEGAANCRSRVRPRCPLVDVLYIVRCVFIRESVRFFDRSTSGPITAKVCVDSRFEHEYKMTTMAHAPTETVAVFEIKSGIVCPRLVRFSPTVVAGLLQESVFKLSAMIQQRFVHSLRIRHQANAVA